MNKKSIMDIKKVNSVKFGNENGNNEFDLREYLTKSPDDLTFYKALKKDKRSFFMFLINMIVKKKFNSPNIFYGRRIKTYFS